MNTDSSLPIKKDVGQSYTDALIIVLPMGMICFVPFALFMRGIRRTN